MLGASCTVAFLKYTSIADRIMKHIVILTPEALKAPFTV